MEKGAENFQTIFKKISKKRGKLKELGDFGEVPL